MTVYYPNETSPAQGFTLYESDKVTVVPLTTGGWTGKVQIIRVDNEDLIVEQSTNITLANTAPNLIRTQWAAATLAAIITDMGAETTVDYKERPVITLGSLIEGIGNGDPVIHTFKAIPV